jgi:translation initiation factor IF-2
MAKIRVHQLAKELDVPSQKIIDQLKRKGIEVKNHFSALDKDAVALIKKLAKREENRGKVKSFKQVKAQPSSNSTKSVSAPPPQPASKAVSGESTFDSSSKTSVAEPKEEKQKIKLVEGITVKEFADAVGKTANEIIKMLIRLGEMATINQPISQEALDVLADDLGYEIELQSPISREEEMEVDDKSLLEPRPPVVTVMGHVDHGKTLLLDAIRKTDVVSSEAGGITQHIGAYQIMHKNRKITFIDTPGHEAFTAMRARGARVTDVAVLVVAADDGVMPQTVEAIDHAKAAGVPIVVAINKIDKPEANPDKVRQQLSDYQLIPEEWGGDTVFVNVSAKKKINIDELLEMLLLVADISEVKANPKAPAQGVVIEAKLDRGRGPVATVLVQRGTLKVGDVVVTGKVYGRARALINDKGIKVKSAAPGEPVEILGLSGLPEPGYSFKAMENERQAKQLAESRALKSRLLEQRRTHVTLDDLYQKIREGEIRDLNLVIKADTQGSIEALRESLAKLDQKQVRINVIHKSVGGITETDVMLASASNAIIIGFNVRPTAKARDMAEKEKVDIRTYRVIYQVVEDIEAARKGLLAPKIEEEDIGLLEVKQVFKVPKIGIVAGCYVSEGIVNRNAKARVVRDSTIIFEGNIISLRRFKDDVKEVKSGFECGLRLEDFQDVKPGDVIEIYQEVEVKQ